MYQSYGSQGGYGGEAPVEEFEDEEEFEGKKQGQLSCWGNQQSMNLNPLILTNITGSPYFKVQLFNIKTYHEVIDEIYYKVDHLEPWERGSRKTSGQTGMCGGVRGVGAGGIVSSAYCLLYKLYTLKLTRKQVTGLLVHCDSPFIRGLGFMYLRYTQTPSDLMGWFEEYLDDPEEIDPKAGGGKKMTMGEMAKSMLVKLEWFDTRFPRIPVNVQKQINASLGQRLTQGNDRNDEAQNRNDEALNRPSPNSRGKSPVNPLSRNSSDVSRRQDNDKKGQRSYSGDPSSKSRDRRSMSRDRRSRSKETSKSRDRKSREQRSRSRDRRHRDESKNGGKKDRNRGHKSHRRSRSRSKDSHRNEKRHDETSRDDFADELRQYSEHRKTSHKKRRSKSRSRDRR